MVENKKSNFKEITIEILKLFLIAIVMGLLTSTFFLLIMANKGNLSEKEDHVEYVEKQYYGVNDLENETGVSIESNNYYAFEHLGQTSPLYNQLIIYDNQQEVSNADALYQLRTIPVQIVSGHKYLIYIKDKTNITSVRFRYPFVSLFYEDNYLFVRATETGAGAIQVSTRLPNQKFTINYNLIDLTQLYGAGNEPSEIEDFNERTNYIYDLNNIPYTPNNKIWYEPIKSFNVGSNTINLPTNLDSWGYGVNYSAYNYLDLINNEYHQKVKAIDISTLNWTLHDTYGSWYTDDLASTIKKPSDNDTLSSNLICSGVPINTATNVYFGNVGIGVTRDGWIYYKNNSNTSPSGILVYEGVTETVQSINPVVPNTYIYMKSGQLVEFSNADGDYGGISAYNNLVPADPKDLYDLGYNAGTNDTLENTESFKYKKYFDNATMTLTPINSDNIYNLTINSYQFANNFLDLRKFENDFMLLVDLSDIEYDVKIHNINIPAQQFKFTFTANSTIYDNQVYVKQSDNNYVPLDLQADERTYVYIPTNNDVYITEIGWTGLYEDYFGYGISLGNEAIAYNNGYRDGQANGYINGYNVGSQNGYQEGIDKANATINENSASYIQGKEDGYNLGANAENSLYNMIIAVADTPINIFKQIFNFNILGINIAGIVFSILSLLVIIWIIKKII